MGKRFGELKNSSYLYTKKNKTTIRKEKIEL